MLRRLKEKKKKGFTLVELIVVLVILAILAALLVPALTGYIDKAKNKAIIAETRQTVMAAQTLVDEAYGKKDVGVAVTIGSDKTDVTYQQVADLAELKVENITGIELNTAKDGAAEAGTKVVKVTYVKGSKTCVYDPANSKTNSDGDYNCTKTK